VTALPPSVSRLWTRRFVTVLGAQFAFGLGWSTYLVQPKFLVSALGAPPDRVGRIIMMSSVAAIAMIPVTLGLLDRVNRAWIFRAGLVLLIGASLGYTAVHQLTPWLFLLQGAVGASYSLAYNASAAVIADEAPRERLGEAIGLLGASNVVTNAIATTVAENVAHAFGWRAAFETALAFGAFAMLLSYRLGGERPLRHASLGVVPIGPALRGSLRHVLFASALMGAAFAAMFTFQQPYVLALGGKNVSPFFVGFTVAAVSVRLFLGSLGDRYGHRRVSRIALVAYGTVALATAWLRVGYLWIYGLAFGCAHGVAYPTLSTDGVHAAPDGARGRALALYAGAFNVGNGLALLGWGEVASRFGYPALFAAAAVVAYAGVAVLPGSARTLS
jgi:MFS family permease